MGAQTPREMRIAKRTAVARRDAARLVRERKSSRSAVLEKLESAEQECRVLFEHKISLERHINVLKGECAIMRATSVAPSAQTEIDDAAKAEIESMRAQLAEARARADGIDDAAKAEIESMRAQLAEARARADGIDDAAKAEIESMRAQLAEARARADGIDDAAKAEIESMRAQLAEARARADGIDDAAKAEIESMRAQLAEARARADGIDGIRGTWIAPTEEKVHKYLKYAISRSGNAVAMPVAVGFVAACGISTVDGGDKIPIIARDGTLSDVETMVKNRPDLYMIEDDGCLCFSTT